MHLPYAEAAAEQVVVEWRAKRRKGVVAFVVAGCMTKCEYMPLLIVARDARTLEISLRGQNLTIWRERVAR